MAWKECVLDAEISRDGVFTFCPIEGDIEGEFVVVTGLNFVGMPPKGMRMVAVVHSGGNAAVNEFCERYRTELDTLSDRLKQHDPETYAGLVHEEQLREF